MKKFVLALVALTFLFCSCNKEGVYNQKKKILSVDYQVVGDGPQELLEDYTWDGNKLKRKLFRGSVLSQFMDDVDLVPTYNGKRIVRVDEKISGEYVDYIYDGQLLSKLIYHSKDEVVNATVEHQNGKISRIFFKAKSKTNGEKLMKMLLPPSKIQMVSEQVEQATKNLNPIDYELLFTWKGDNVIKIELLNDRYKMVSELEYDNKLNPYAIDWVDFGSELQMFQNILDGQMLAMSKNNITKCYSEVITGFSSGEPRIGAYTELTTYEYDGKYPVKATRTDEEGSYEEIFYYKYK